MSSKITPIKPFILILYGFPGSGKTTFAKQFCEEFGLVHLQEDKLAKELFEGTHADDAVQKRATDYLSGELLKSGVSLVVDSNRSLRTKERKLLSDLAKQNKAASLTIWFQIDPETAYMRLQNRDRRKSEDKYAKEYTEKDFRSALSAQQNPKESEAYAVISGKHTYSSQRSAVLKRLYDLNLIETTQMSQKIAKPGLVNLIPHRGDITRRNISIR